VAHILGVEAGRSEATVREILCGKGLLASLENVTQLSEADLGSLQHHLKTTVLQTLLPSRFMSASCLNFQP